MTDKQHDVLPEKLYVGAMNDALFLIDEPPRPTPVDYHNPTLKTEAIAIIQGAGNADRERAARLAATWNACQGIETEVLAQLDGAIKPAITGFGVESRRADEAEALLRDLVEGLDTGNVQMDSAEIDNDVEVPPHPWHEEWLYHVRTFLEARKL